MTIYLSMIHSIISWTGCTSENIAQNRNQNLRGKGSSTGKHRNSKGISQDLHSLLRILIDLIPDLPFVANQQDLCCASRQPFPLNPLAPLRGKKRIARKPPYGSLIFFENPLIKRLIRRTVSNIFTLPPPVDQQAWLKPFSTVIIISIPSIGKLGLERKITVLLCGIVHGIKADTIYSLPYGL